MRVLIFFLLPFFIARLLRWLALVQQKEYRLDRLVLFAASASGIREYFYIPSLSSFTRSGLKRPALTARAVWVGILSSLALILLYTLIDGFKNQPLIYLTLVFVLYFLIADLVLVAALLTAPFVYIVTEIELIRARRKIAKRKPSIIGITGSYGKTSTKLLTSHLLAQKYSLFTTPLSYNTKYSIAKSILDGYKGEALVLIEYGAYKRGEIRRLTHYFTPSIAVITGIAPQHLGLFGSIEKLIKAKSELIEALPSDGVVFCNAKDEGVLSLCRNSGRKTVDYSGKESKVKLTKPTLDYLGKLSFGWDGKVVETQLVGRHYLEVCQAAIAVSLQFNLSKSQIIEALQSFKPPPSFISVMKHKSGALVIDDSGTSNPAGFKASLSLASELKRKRNILIFSGIVDLGNESFSIHSSLAKQAERLFSIVLYPGFDGRKAFEEVFGKKLVTNGKKISEALGSLDKETLVLVEGRIPVVLAKFLLGEAQ